MMIAGKFTRYIPTSGKLLKDSSVIKKILLGWMLFFCKMNEAMIGMKFNRNSHKKL